MTIAILFASILSALNPFHTDDRVATASLVFRVEDDRGAPVENAKVEVFFDMECDPGETVTTTTDTNGMCRVKGKTVGVMEFRVLKEEYYSAYGKIIFNAAGNEYEKHRGKWQPWDMERKVVLPKIRNRVAEPFKSDDRRWTKHINEWIGFDLLLSDYVEPFGTGKVTDFEVKFDWDGKRFKEYNGIDIRLRFPDEHAGVYWTDAFVGSDLNGVYEANESAKYEKEISFGDIILRNEKGVVYKRELKKFDETKVLVGRTRCVVNEDGELSSATYFQIYFIGYSCGTKGVAIRCAGFYNPTPNDTNIEPK